MFKVALIFLFVCTLFSSVIGEHHSSRHLLRKTEDTSNSNNRKLDEVFIGVHYRTNGMSVNSDNFNCTSDAQCNYNGVCTDSNKCQCDDDYATHDPDGNDDQCNYKRKDQTSRISLVTFSWNGWCGTFLH